MDKELRDLIDKINAILDKKPTPKKSGFPSFESLMEGFHEERSKPF